MGSATSKPNRPISRTAAWTSSWACSLPSASTDRRRPSDPARPSERRARTCAYVPVHAVPVVLLRLVCDRLRRREESRDQHDHGSRQREPSADLDPRVEALDVLAARTEHLDGEQHETRDPEGAPEPSEPAGPRGESDDAEEREHDEHEPDALDEGVGVPEIR